MWLEKMCLPDGSSINWCLRTIIEFIHLYFRWTIAILLTILKLRKFVVSRYTNEIHKLKPSIFFSLDFFASSLFKNFSFTYTHNWLVQVFINVIDTFISNLIDPNNYIFSLIWSVAISTLWINSFIKKKKTIEDKTIARSRWCDRLMSSR